MVFEISSSTMFETNKLPSINPTFVGSPLSKFGVAAQLRKQIMFLAFEKPQ
jgi:hypothetical protein